MTSDRPLRIALLTYRGNPHSGGQGVYTRQLSAALAAEGHQVDVISGPPYPDVDDGVRLVKLPSLDLYNPANSFKPQRKIRGAVDVLEMATMSAGVYPEPLTFSLRVWKRIAAAGYPYDVIHDNQSLGFGLLAVARKVPVVATIHHAITIDRDLQLAEIGDDRKRAGMRRWFRFVDMQRAVAKRFSHLIAVSEAARDDIVRDFGVSASRFSVIANGVNPDVFRPLPETARVPGRIAAVISADLPLKGLHNLIEAMAKLRANHAVELVVVGRCSPENQALIKRLGLSDAVRFESDVSEQRLVELNAEAQMCVIASRYEGFSLPAVEAMACGIPVVATTGGALPEVVGANEEAGLLVKPGSPDELAAAISRLLSDDDLRERLGQAGRKRVLEKFTWERAAVLTAEVYRQAITS